MLIPDPSSQNDVEGICCVILRFLGTGTEKTYTNDRTLFTDSTDTVQYRLPFQQNLNKNVCTVEFLVKRAALSLTKGGKNKEKE
jgi:hypothetical protein